ncbi:scavenger receptor cysteine-rich domain superfamily protein-like [Mytilus edulis]|uniref:scavenger receptor cysteine-rich domain superfamily protein-like n=1 Tax=Mytilus edulis TaxID=6550 RepID=UPI0039EEEB66
MLFQLLFICGSVFLVKGQTTLTLAGNGATSSQGRVEVTWNNIKGTVCKNNFTDLSASVVCRQLNFTNGGVAVTDGRFGAGTGTILLDNVNCNGTEQDILECSYDNQTNCVHSDDIGVICNGTTSVPITVQPSNCTPDNLDIRLVGPANLIGVGYVEVRRNGVWGSVCDDLWGKQDAQVVCRMLCYDPNNAQAGAPIDIDHAKDQVSTTYHLDDVECIGTETNITNCTQSDGNHNCDAVQQEFASVTCVPLINTRLTGKSYCLLNR